MAIHNGGWPAFEVLKDVCEGILKWEVKVGPPTFNRAGVVALIATHGERLYFQRVEFGASKPNRDKAAALRQAMADMTTIIVEETALIYGGVYKSPTYGPQRATPASPAQINAQTRQQQAEIDKLTDQFGGRWSAEN